MNTRKVDFDEVPCEDLVFVFLSELITKKNYKKYHNNCIECLYVYIYIGSPPPTVTWMSKGQVLTSSMLDYSFQSALNNKLVVHNLSRVHQHAVYTCHASNFHKKSVSTNVTVELYRK